MLETLIGGIILSVVIGIPVGLMMESWEGGAERAKNVAFSMIMCAVLGMLMHSCGSSNHGFCSRPTGCIGGDYDD
jgi:hypothetical protein